MTNEQKLREALEPFAMLADVLGVIDEPGGTGAWGGMEQNQRISCWIGPSDLALARAALAATEPAPQPVAVKVKPLVWDVTGWSSDDGVKGENDNEWTAPLLGYRYAAYCIFWFGGDLFRLTDPDDNVSRHNSLSDAKAAAQADYEARILAALDLTQPTAQDAARVPEIAAMADEAHYWVNNPSAWDHFDQGASDVIEKLVSALRAIGGDA